MGLAALRPAAFANAAELTIDRLRADHADPANQKRRDYRVDAVVSVLGVTVFSQKGVGSAFASLQERVRESAEGLRRFTSLQFAGASNPEKAHGVNYGGSSEEAVEEYAERRRSAYFGFVTASNDEDIEHAREHLRSASNASVYTVVAGACGPESVESRRARIEIAERGLQLDELIRRVRAGFCANTIPASIVASQDRHAPTFLYAVLSAIREAGTRFESAYIHDGKAYRIECQKSLESPGSLIRLNAQIRDHNGRRVSAFKLWTEPGCDFPVRIEFQARSYIRLILEAA